MSGGGSNQPGSKKHVFWLFLVGLSVLMRCIGKNEMTPVDKLIFFFKFKKNRSPDLKKSFFGPKKWSENIESFKISRKWLDWTENMLYSWYQSILGLSRPFWAFYKIRADLTPPLTAVKSKKPISKKTAVRGGVKLARTLKML